MFTLKRQDRSQINNLTLQLKELGGKKRTNPKARRREIMKIRAGTKGKEERKINETKKWFSKKINKIDTNLSLDVLRKREDSNY